MGQQFDMVRLQLYRWRNQICIWFYRIGDDGWNLVGGKSILSALIFYRNGRPAIGIHYSPH
jgi:hypothetical protein